MRHPSRPATNLGCVSTRYEAEPDREATRENDCPNIRLIAYGGVNKSSGKNLILP